LKTDERLLPKRKADHVSPPFRQLDLLLLTLEDEIHQSERNHWDDYQGGLLKEFGVPFIRQQKSNRIGNDDDSQADVPRKKIATRHVETSLSLTKASCSEFRFCVIEMDQSPCAAAILLTDALPKRQQEYPDTLGPSDVYDFREFQALSPRVRAGMRLRFLRPSVNSMAAIGEVRPILPARRERQV
jgi:hypothetical protein